MISIYNWKILDTRDNEMRRKHPDQVSKIIKRKISLHGFTVHKMDKKKQWWS